ncbi:MAG: tetratricopeptide repeat protein [Chitinophagaceae bacterium]
MQKSQFTLAAVGVLLVVVLYTLGRTTPDKQANPGIQGNESAGMAASAAPADFNLILQDAQKNLPPAVLLEMKSLENKVVRGDVKDQQIVVDHRLSQIWDSLHHVAIGAHYLAEAAKLENSEKSLTFAANLFLNHLQQVNDAGRRKWEAVEARELLLQATQMDPSNDSLQVALADANVESGNVMAGVQQLLSITRSDPDNVQANVLLGRLAVISGQFDKAISRLNVVLVHHPDNVEALYFLGEAYRGKGDKAKAIQTFERCKKLVNDPAFTQQIDAYEKSFR